MANPVTLLLTGAAASKLDEMTGTARQIAVDTETVRPRVFDGKTKGGKQLAFKDEVPDVAALQAAIAANTSAIDSFKTSFKAACEEITAAKGA